MKKEINKNKIQNFVRVRERKVLKGKLAERKRNNKTTNNKRRDERKKQKTKRRN